jgi:hypothetical protein
MDFENKTLVGEYSYTDANKDRNYSKCVLINGRKYIKLGVKTATTVVAFQYKVFNPSINRSEYVTLMGVARQHAGDAKISLEEGYEIAATNAMISPIATFKFPKKCSEYTIRHLMMCYVDELPVNFVKTKEELDENNVDFRMFERSLKSKDKDFIKYYNDVRNLNVGNINNKIKNM